MIRLLGRPIERSKYPDEYEYWYYTGDGKCQWMDFAWLGRELRIDHKGKVIEVIRLVHYD